ncbi:hypothetical protein [Brevibacillus sp. NRS-1366]|uniref:hypothetical protein n=1 Tax=Brevibacillus sp. NRS-1366 TaxID=3233899 RepID=UPI003D1ED956
MKKGKWLTIVIVLVLVVVGGFIYQTATLKDETYSGMSIIPEKQEDIPLFKGLKPTEFHYEMQGDHWEDIYHFYQNELPKYGWTLTYQHASENEDESVSGFITRWRKPDVDWELSVRGSSFALSKQTEVVFDKHGILHSTTWIENVPDRICVSEKAGQDSDCVEITDKAKITEIVRMVNDAFDWKEEVTPRQNKSTLDFGDQKVSVLYESDQEIYFQSEKGTKLMKPEPEFFELTGLVR